MKTKAKFHELRLGMIPHSSYSPDQDHSDIFLSSDLKRMVARKKNTETKAILKRKTWRPPLISYMYNASSFIRGGLKFADTIYLRDNFQAHAENLL